MVITWSRTKNFVLMFIVFAATSLTCFNITITFCGKDIKDRLLKRPLCLKTVSKKHNISTVKAIQPIIECANRYLDIGIQQRGEFWVLYNYVRAEKKYEHLESVTYTTQGDFTFLNNVVPLVERWNGPISLAVHAPGYDFQFSLDSIAYLRKCEKSSPLVRKYVTFHLFFNAKHIPLDASSKKFNVSLFNLYKDEYDCKKIAPYIRKNYKTLYKTTANLTYPINVARNVARTAALTHFVLASDIELYPTSNLSSKFLDMVVRRKDLFQSKIPKVFVLPVFEVLVNQSVPKNKTILQQMIKTKKAIPFHQKLCTRCHAIPNANQWLDLEEGKDLNVFITTKRQGKQEKWEAFYIGTNNDPLYDERLSWEGQSNKMPQGYSMCLLNYDYHVLDNAFLTHKPGIKLKRIQPYKYSSLIAETQLLIHKSIKLELENIYGANDRCKM